MIKKFAYNLIYFLPLLLFRCGEANYILDDQTPPISEGFFGIRWTTPMAIVDSEFPKHTGAITQSSLNQYNTSNFSNAYFLGELPSLERFTFNERGLTSIKIIFKTNFNTYENKFDLLLKKVVSVYGKPIELFGIVEFPDIPDYIVCYYWNGKRLELKLKLDYSIEINAYSYSPLDGPIYNTK